MNRNGRPLAPGVCKAFTVGTCLVLVVPKPQQHELNVGAGSFFLVRTDEAGRLIYEPVTVERGGKRTARPR